MAEITKNVATAHEPVEEPEYNIIISGKRIKGTRANGEEYDFISFIGYEKSGKKASFNFTRDCNDVPEEEGEYIITVKKKYINKDKNVRFNRYWIKELESVVPYDGYIENEEDLDF